MDLNLSLFWVIAFLLVLAWTLDRTLIKPLTRVMQEREQAIASAQVAGSACRRDRDPYRQLSGAQRPGYIRKSLASEPS